MKKDNDTLVLLSYVRPENLLTGIPHVPTRKVSKDINFVIVCQHNNHARSEYSNGPHGRAVLIGRGLSCEYERYVKKAGSSRGTHRCTVRFQEYAYLHDFNLNTVWQTQVSRIRYAQLGQLGVPVEQLEWQAAPIPGSASEYSNGTVRMPEASTEKRWFTIEQAREALALKHDLTAEQVKLTLDDFEN